MPYTTDMNEGMVTETVTIQGHNGDSIHAYVARPTATGAYPGVLLFHHMPGWDEWYKEATRRFAYHGYIAISPDLYCRAGHAAPDDVTARVRAEGGVADDQVVGDAEGAIRYLRGLPELNGKVALFGTCSGGRHAYLAGCRAPGVDAVIDCWGGGVVMQLTELTEKRPVAPLDYTTNLTVPLLGLFGEDDRSPTPEQVDQHESELKRLGKTYEFHRYPGAGHGFFYYDRPAAYRAEAAVDGWTKVWDFLARTVG
jgi:carboxymethylenebutenolidase